MCVVCFFRTAARRCSCMPRSTADVPASWIQIVRGPRPLSEQWPRQTGATRSPGPVLCSAPEADVPVCRCQGQGHALKSELEKARQAARAPPKNVQISSTQDFIRRSERRLAELEAERTTEPSNSRRPGSVCASWSAPGGEAAQGKNLLEQGDSLFFLFTLITISFHE